MNLGSLPQFEQTMLQRSNIARDLPRMTVREALAHDWLGDGDLLLLRRRSLVSRMGRGLHSHAMLVGVWDQEPMALEVREWYGGRAVTLESQVARFPGRIELYGANPANRWPEFDRLEAVRYFRGRYCGCRYGWWHIAQVSLLHLVGVRLIAPPDTDDQDSNGHAPFCSEAVAAATRLGGGVDPVPTAADRMTEPADLARSPFYRARCALVPA